MSEKKIYFTNEQHENLYKDVTLDRSETLNNLTKHVDDYIENIIVNDKIPTKYLADKGDVWKKYY